MNVPEWGISDGYVLYDYVFRIKGMNKMRPQKAVLI
jgi:hypothetical protein